MSASVSVASRHKQIAEKCEQLLETIEAIEEIESSQQHSMFLEDIKKLSELLGSSTFNVCDLMATSWSENRKIESETFANLLSEILKRFGKSFRTSEEIPTEIMSLAQVSDDDLILETMSVLSDSSLMQSSPFFISEIMVNLLSHSDYLTFVFVKMSLSRHSEEKILKIDHFIQQLINFPDKVANKMKADFPRPFERRRFGANLLVNALKCFHTICQINKLEQFEVYSVKFLSKLISKVFVHFKADRSVTLCCLQMFSSLAEKDEYQNHVRALMGGLQRSAIELTAKFAFENEERKQRLICTFGDVWKSSSDWKFVLMKKFPLLSFSSDDTFVENYAFFVASEDMPTMEQILTELLTVWITKSHVMDAPFEQHFFVTKLIVLMTKYLPNPKERAESLKRLVFNGIQVHLQSSDKKIQVLGMITAETILGLLDQDLKDEETLKFDYSEIDKRIVSEIVDVIRLFPLKAVASEGLEILEICDESEVDKTMKKLIAFVEGHETQSIQPKFQEEKKRLQPTQIEPTKEATKQELDSDDDDDLKAYDDPDDYPRRLDDKRPKYLLDLIQAFTNKEHAEDAEKFEVSVMSAEEIIKQQLPNQHPDIGIDLLRIFVSLDKTCYMEQDFEEIKMKVLIQICMIHPKEAAQHLCQEFNTETSKYSMNRRMLMLDVLAETAKKLSKLEMKKSDEITASPAPPQTQNKLLIKLNEELENRNQRDAQKIIRQRLLAKTRRIATRTKAPDEDSGINRFAEVAGWFFFPLVHGFGRKQMVFKTGTNLKDDIDNLLLVKFLNTIAVMMLCAENSLVASKMAKEIMSMSAFLRFHEESNIRLAVLHMVATIILALPKRVLVNEFPREIDEFMNHLRMIVKSTVVNYEPDHDCREFANQLLAMFQNVLYSEN